MFIINSLLGRGKSTPKGDVREHYEDCKTEGELYEVTKRDGKVCLFMQCELNLVISNTPSILIKNEMYDPHQENLEEQVINLTDDLTFMSYIGYDTDDRKYYGLSFYNGYKNYLFQFTQECKVEILRYYISQLLFEVKTKKDHKSATHDEIESICQYFIV